MRYARHGVNVRTAERIVSAVVGAALLVLGLGRRTARGSVLAAAGGALLRRGLSGRCDVYRALRLGSA